MRARGGRNRGAAAAAALVACALVLVGAPAAEAGASERPAVDIHDGAARFQVLTPTLIRLEYAADGGFENRPTLTAINRAMPPPKVRTKIADGHRVIKTSAAVLRYRLDSGPFNPANLSLRVRTGGVKGSASPDFATGAPTYQESSPPQVPNPNPDPSARARTSGNLGGWYRSLDNQSGPVPLHDGLLSRDGWYLLNDTTSPLLIEGGSWYEPRPKHNGAYQDGYLFVYGHDYARGLRDFRALTGPAPLLPRQAFGNWFSRYYGYSMRSYQKLLRKFRAERVPLDVLVVDTDFKWPNPWNGWQWTEPFFPDPRAFLKWAHSQRLDVGLNVHPSISVEDPSYAGADAAAGGLGDSVDRCQVFTQARAASCGVWDWAQRDDVASYFSLHQPFEADGVDFWWLDWCCDESNATAPGLPPDTWINALYTERQRARGVRWPALSRIGSSIWDWDGTTTGIWAEHRYAVHFTGDTLARWSMLDFQTRFTAAEGAGIGMPYVSHDIGSFHSEKLPSDLYVRWMQFGAFQPILRVHSNHGFRLPWEYGKRAERIASGFMRLRGTMIPFLYTLGRQAYDSGLPLARPMYLGWPKAGAAYRFDGQYMLGDSLLVAPIAKPGKRSAKRVWFPPGQWVDIFTGAVRRGGGTRVVTAPLDRMPVFARAGSIVPRQPYSGQVGRGQAEKLTLDVYGGADGKFTLYEDKGEGFGYVKKQFARTQLRWNEGRRSAQLSIGRARGKFKGLPRTRGYELRIANVRRPKRIVLAAGGRTRKLRGWRLDRATRRLEVPVGRIGTRRGGTVRLEY